jgi:hypothetical protein
VPLYDSRMVEPSASEQPRPVDAWGDGVHPAQPRHGAIPGGVTGGNGWRGLLLAALAVLVAIGVLVYLLLS